LNAQLSVGVSAGNTVLGVPGLANGIGRKPSFYNFWEGQGRLLNVSVGGQGAMDSELAKMAAQEVLGTSAPERRTAHKNQGKLKENEREHPQGDSSNSLGRINWSLEGKGAV